MTHEEAEARYMQINRWRQRLVWQEFFGGGLQPWQEMQVRAYRDEMDRLEPHVYPEMYEALDQWEDRIRVQEAFADALEARISGSGTSYVEAGAVQSQTVRISGSGELPVSLRFGTLKATARYWEAIAAGEEPSPEDAAVVRQLDCEAEEEEERERPGQSA